MSWTAITNLGDAAVMIPAVGAIGLWLCWLRAWGLAARWFLLVGLAVGAVVATKLAFLGWGIGSEALDFTGISGHSTLATSVMPILAALLASTGPRGARLAAMSAGYALGVLIAASRAVLHFHSLSEIAAGCIVGGLVVLLLASRIGALPAPRYASILPLATALMVIMLCADGDRAPSDHLLRQAAMELSGTGRCYSREDWRRAPNRDDARLPRG